MSDHPGDAGVKPSPSLTEGQRDLTNRRIRQGAMEVVARRGFDATIEEIADCCGVSARTIFRHYASHDALILATVKAMFEATGERPIAGLTPPDVDLDSWLECLAKTIHTRNAEIMGDAFWDIHGPFHQDSSVLHEVGALRRQYRRRGVEYLGTLAWQTAGGKGPPPDNLRLAFALEFSAFTTHALMIDFDRTPSEVGELTAQILKTLLVRAVQAQRRELAGGAGDADDLRTDDDGED